MQDLTPLQKEIVILVAKVYKNQEIAQKLGFAEQTVRNYLTEIYSIVGVNNRAGMTNWAWHNGMMNPRS